MSKANVIVAAFLLDWIAGDPEWLPHPVRLLGRSIEAGEKLLRKPGQNTKTQLLAGGVLTFGVVAFSYLTTSGAIHLARRWHARAGVALEVLLGWTCLACRNLVDESQSVICALKGDQLITARQRLSRIVGRDTQALDEGEISRAIIETLAESTCDGIVAPLLFMTAGGVPLAMAYKAVNTLDSMIGHADQRYFYFGKVAARLDDVANYLPARLTAFAIVLAAGSGAAPGVWQTWRQDGHKHKSPNAGHPESAMSGALRVRLGGQNTYAGEPIVTPLLGSGFPLPTVDAARGAINMVIRVSFMALAASLAFRHMRK